MKKSTLKICCMLMALVLFTGMLGICANAEEAKYTHLLALGDSITTGYGLADYEFDNPYKCASYANRLAKTLGLTAGETYFNKAINGYRTNDLLALLPSLEEDVKAADLIVISIGGNNLLQNLNLVASMIAGRQITSYAEAIPILTTATYDTYIGLLGELQTVLAADMAAVLTDTTGICNLIAQYNPGAEVVFLLQYNPSNGVPGLEGFNAVTAYFVQQINAMLKQAIDAAPENFNYVDVPSVIDNAAAARTNILSSDIHPNIAGHGEIFKLLETKLGITEPEETTAEETEEQTEAQTEAATDAETEEQTEKADEKKTGCKSSVALCIMPAMAAAFVFARKKH